MSEENQEVQEATNLDNNEVVTPESTEQPVTESTSESTQEQQPKTVTLEIPENWEYNGDRKSVPKPLEKYVKNLDRYVSKKDQALAEARKKAEEYESLVNSDTFKQYQQYIQSNQGKTEPQPLFTQDELDAISLGDGKTLQSVIDRAVEAKLQNDPSRSTLQSIEQKQRLLDVKEQMSEFSKVNPEFNDLIESPAGDHMIAAVQRGASLDQAYQAVQEVKEYFFNMFENQRKANLEKKAKGSVVKSTVTGTPDVVWAENDMDARRKAIELQLKGDPRKVQIKPKR